MKGIPEGVFGGDNRAVAPVLGVILLFGIAAIGVSVWQTTVIPSQNADTEFNHYMEVQGDMGDLRQAHLETAASGEPKAPTLKLGVAYTTRVIGVNPPDPSGTIRDEDVGSFSLENATAKTSDEEVSAKDLCGVPPQTDRLRYDPSYNRLSDRETPPVKYENTVLYRSTTDDEFIVESDQQLIQGSTINILPVQNDLDRTGRSTSIDLSSEGYVEKDLETGAMPRLVVPTDIPVETWRDELLKPSSNVYVNGVTPAPGGVAIQLANLESRDSSRWTVRCAVTTDGETSYIPQNLDTPPFVQNGGFGRGGVTEHTVDSNTDTVTLPNGKWIEIDSISQLNFLGAETTGVTGNDLNGGEGIAVEYKVSDGRSDEVVYLKVAVTKGTDGSWQDKVVKMGPSPGSYQDGPTLTDRAANKILENGDVNVLDPANYQAETFDTSDGNFGAYVQDVRRMESATIRTTDLQGRVNMEVLTGDLTLDVQDDDERQAYVKGNTSEITFDITASGRTDAPENVDLKISKSGSDGLVESPRSDRETIDLAGGSEEFTLTWEPNWNSLSGGATYEILVEGESDQSFAKVRILQKDNAYVEVEIVDHNAPVEYGDDLTAEVRAENIGDTQVNDSQLQLSLAGSSGPQPTVDLAPGEAKNVTMTYDTGQLDTDSIGEANLKATSDNDKDTRTVTIESPSVIQQPTVDDLPAGQDGLDHTMGFTLGEDTDGATIKIDLTDTGDAVSYDSDVANWYVDKGQGSISLNTNNNKVTSVKYETNSEDRADEKIRIVAGRTDTQDADPGVVYDIEYKLTSASNYPQGETNSTSFETTLPE